MGGGRVGGRRYTHRKTLVQTLDMAEQNTDVNSMRVVCVKVITIFTHVLGQRALLLQASLWQHQST